MVSSDKRRVYQILEELEATNQKFNQINYNWLCRKYDPPFEELFSKIFVSKEEMFNLFEKWKKIKKSDDEEDSEDLGESIEESLESQTIDMEKVSNFLLGRSDIKTNQDEIDKLKMLLDNTSKTGNTFLSMMVYKQIERVSRLVSALEVAENRMYSKSVIESVSPIALTNIIDNINKSLKFTLEFIDKMSNQDSGKFKGASITINQTAVIQKDPVSSNTTLSKPARESLRLLAQKLMDYDLKIHEKNNDPE